LSVLQSKEVSSVSDVFPLDNQLQDSTAIIDNSKEVTFSDFSRRVDVLANILLTNLKSLEQPIIAILLRPSTGFLVAMFACLKIGVPYIPLDKKYPTGYVNLILQDAGVDLVISDSGYNSKDLSFNNIDIDDLPRDALPAITYKKPSLSDAAYIIYTSGSTGKPKGVVVTHGNLVALMHSTQPIFGFKHGDVIPLFHSISFDFSVWEICSALFYGATLLIMPEKSRFPSETYNEILIERKVSVLNMTPSMMYQFQELLQGKSAAYLSQLDLRLIITGGEALYPNRLKPWFTLALSERIALYNMYGITEATIHSTVKRISSEDTNQNDSLIGVPLPNMEAVIIDENGKQIFDNQVGELCLSGPAVTKGYLNNSSGDGFFLADFSGVKEKDHYLKTGDLVRRSENNELIYLSRKGSFVKVKGFRVDCKQIKTTLLEFGGVSDAVVTTFLASDGGHRLLACLQGETGATSSINLDETKISLKQLLPEHMFPSRWLVIEEIPLTINRKVDVKRLVELSEQTIEEDVKLEVSQSQSLEKTISDAWKDVLGVSSLNHDMNFFDAGGDSLLLVILQMKLKSKLKQEVSMDDLLQFPTIEKLVTRLKDKY
jgi:amino acid adenylation domain-containing protein